MSIQLFKDGDQMAIRTDCPNEYEFNHEFSALLGTLINDGEHDGDWEFQFSYWLPQYVDLCCAYRGYKSEVDKRTVLLAGSRLVPSKPAHEIDTHGSIFHGGTEEPQSAMVDEMVKDSIKNAKKVKTKVK